MYHKSALPSAFITILYSLLFDSRSPIIKKNKYNAECRYSVFLPYFSLVSTVMEHFS